MMMQRLEPLHLDGGKLAAGSLLWEHGNHAFLHIFRDGPDDVVSHTANRVLLPTSRGQSVRRRLLSIPPLLRAPVLTSHGINDEAYDALVANDAPRFVKVRARYLAQIERAFMHDLRLTPPSEEFGDADIDTDDD
jgi:hypothetical protein